MEELGPRTNSMGVCETTPGYQSLSVLVCDGWRLGIKPWSWEKVWAIALEHPGGRTEAQGSLGSDEQCHLGQEVAVSLLMRGGKVGCCTPKEPESEWAEITSPFVHHMQPLGS